MMILESERQPSTVGLSLEGDRPWIHTWHGSAIDGSSRNPLEGLELTPPSALLPQLPGEPHRGDFLWPCHIRGSGQCWPPEATVSKLTGAGRYPLPYAWAMLGSKASWFWSSSGAVQQQLAEEAIAAVGKAIVSDLDSSCRLGQACLVIPDGLSMAAQQRLLDASRRQGMSVRLLWRSVAAVAAWIEHFKHVLPDDRKLPGQKVLHLHLGFDSIEASLLDVVFKDDSLGHTHLIPARYRPVGQPLWGFGLGCIEHLAACSLRGSSNASMWQLLWASPWLPQTLQALRCQSSTAEQDPAHSVMGNNTGSKCRIVDWEKAYEEAFSSILSKEDYPQPKADIYPQIHDLQSWRSAQLAPLLENHQALAGAVVTGPLASLPFKGKTLGEFWLHRTKVDFNSVALEGREMPLGFMSIVAARHLAKLRDGLPTYLDTLPRLQIVISHRGEPAWQDLLKDDDKFVDGGEVFHKPAVCKGSLYIAAHRSTLEVSLNHEEHPTVRTHDVALPRQPDHNMPIYLNVSVTPAQGNARVEVMPEDKDFFGRRTATVDWLSNMADTELEPDEFLEDLPRILPPTDPRLSSLALWKGNHLYSQYQDGAAGAISDYLDNGKVPMETLIECLRQKDADYRPREATAVGSDGIPGLGSEAEISLLQKFVDKLMDRIAGHSPNSDQYLRVLAYTSTDSPRLREYLDEQLRDAFDDLQPFKLAACGWCLRDSQAIARFATLMFARLRESLTGTSNWLKAFWELLRYRDNATENIDSDLCLCISRLLLRIVEDEKKKQNFNLRFRYATGGIVYLLRRRAYDADYLDPAENKIAEDTKNVFHEAIASINANPNKVMGGFVDLPKQLNLIIDYIDKKGHGPVYLVK